ncbi:MAG: two-component system cell cycle response regulator [Gammaproteobacteria bacterium]|jgi:two-component system cell cycle response regulator
MTSQLKSTKAEYSETTKLREYMRPLLDEPAKRNAYLTVLNGAAVGRTYRLGPGRLIVGRASDCDVVLDDDGVSRRHALFIASADGKVILEDLGSTNGTGVDGQKQNVFELQGGERLRFGSDTVFKFEFRDALEEEYATYLYESATQDHLTGVFNERFLRDQMEVEFAWHVRHDTPLSVIFIDIDNFKQINDEYGHLVGDQVLRELAVRCLRATRTEDVFARYGGEEFTCLLRETNLEVAKLLAERMRAAVAESPFECTRLRKPCLIDVTISAGVAELDPNQESPEELLEQADRFLYQAKKLGRNRVESTPEQV